MQRMTKFMKHGRDIVKADERRLALGRFGEIAHVVDHGKGAQQPGLTHQVAHPGPAILVVPFEVVGVKQRQRLTIRIHHLEDAHVGVINGNVFALGKRQPVELVRGVEHAIQQHLLNSK